jgi:Queuosine salvage protein
VTDVLTELRAACAAIAERATQVHLEYEHIPAYIGTLPIDLTAADPDPDAHLTDGSREELAAFWLTLDAINFGSGWFPTLRKPGGRSGYFTIATGLRQRFANHGPWPAPALAAIDATEIAATFGQDPDHELMALFAASLSDLGRRITARHDGHYAGVVDAAGSSAVALVQTLSGWDCFADASRYGGRRVPS